MSDSLADNIRNIPPVTRFFTITTVLVCLTLSLGLLDTSSLFCHYDIASDIVSHLVSVCNTGSWLSVATAVADTVFQCHRFFTTFLIPSGLMAASPLVALMDIYFFYVFASALESPQGKFRGNFPDSLWFTFVTGTVIVLVALALEALLPIWAGLAFVPSHHHMMLSCVTYTWLRSLKNLIINFMGIIPIKAYYLPLFDLGLALILNKYPGLLQVLVGILSGYLYQCIQLNTLPFYNLFPGAYGTLRHDRAGGRRVGFVSVGQPATQEMIEDLIFDKGYLKAPLWLYRALSYPENNLRRQTAFTVPKQPVSLGHMTREDANGSGVSWFGAGGGQFKGRGHRLGG